MNRKQILILLFTIMFNWVHSPVYSQINCGGQLGYLQSGFFSGTSLDILLRSSYEKQFIQCEIGTVLNKNFSPKLSLSLELGRYFKKNTKKTTWTNELNFTYGKFDAGGTAPYFGGMAMGPCNTAKLTITINTGIDYKIWTGNNISLSTFGKLGMGTAMLVESYLPNCKENNLKGRLKFGISIIFGKK